MRLPWSRREDDDLERRAATYEAAIVEALIAGARGTGDGGKVAAQEIASGLWARAFASATVEPANMATQALTPSTLAMIGRRLVDPGEIVLLIDVDQSGATLTPVHTFDLTGGLTWTYEIELAGPTVQTRLTVPAERVVHLRYGATPGEPWKGCGPFGAASTSVDLAGGLETALNQEVRGPRGSLIPTPAGKSDRLQEDIRGLKGNLTLVETTAGNWDQDTRGAPRQDWEPRRIGANPPPVLEALREGVAGHLLAAAGVPVSILSQGDGTAKREGWRQFLHGTIEPVGRLIAEELADKLDTPGLTFAFNSLFASDLSGRARAFQSMVNGGMDVEKAAALAGLLSDDN